MWRLPTGPWNLRHVGEEYDGLSAETEAQSIHALLEANGIESLVVRQNVPELPVGKVEVRVVASDAQRATEVIREGQAGGPAAAEEAEAEQAESE